VENISRQFEFSTSLVYKWREQALAVQAGAAFAPAVLTAESSLASAPPDATAIVIEPANGPKVTISVHASPEFPELVF
jgi:transposase